jgi:hypothetical protein
VADALSSTRTRLLAGIGAAAGTIVIGAVIAGLAQSRSDTPPAPSAPVPSTPTAPATAPKRAGVIKPGTAKTHKPKHKPRHGKRKGRHQRG